MIRRHFLNSSTVNNNCIITYTTLNGDIFDMEAMQKSWQQLVQSMMGSEIPIQPEIISNTYTTYGEMRFSNPVTEIGLGSLSGIPPVFSDVSSTVPDSNKQLTTVTLPPSVVKINTSAFEGCSYLTSINIPNSVTSIGSKVFSDCDSLTSVVWNAENCADFSSSSSGPFASICYQITSFTFGDSVKHIPAYLCFDMYNLTSIIIPNSVTSIGFHAFYNCSSLTSVNIPVGVTSIGDYVFSYCNSLASIDIPNSVTSIGFRAFYNCSSLTSVTLGNSVTSIGEWAFLGCSSLTSITIPNSVTSIGEYAFSSCGKLASITYTGTTAQWDTITKNGGWNDYTPATVVHCTDGDITL